MVGVVADSLFIKQVRDNLYATQPQDTIAYAFRAADCMIEYGYDDAAALRFYQLFVTLALPHAPADQSSIIDQRMRNLLGITTQPTDDKKNIVAHKAAITLEIQVVFLPPVYLR